MYGRQREESILLSAECQPSIDSHISISSFKLNPLNNLRLSLTPKTSLASLKHWLVLSLYVFLNVSLYLSLLFTALGASHAISFSSLKIDYPHDGSCG